MTYRELREKLNNLTEDCLDTDVVLFESGIQEYYPIHNLVLTDETCDVLDEGHPLLLSNN